MIVKRYRDHPILGNCLTLVLGQLRVRFWHREQVGVRGITASGRTWARQLARDSDGQIIYRKSARDVVSYLSSLRRHDA